MGSLILIPIEYITLIVYLFFLYIAMTLVQQTNSEMTTAIQNAATKDLIDEQEVMSKEWLLGKIPQCFIHFFDGVDDVTDISAVYVANLRKYGYDKIVMIPYYDEMDDEWIYKPMFAMTALASFIGHKDPEHITRYTLKDHIVKTGNELNDEIKGWLKQPPPMIFHEGLTEGIFRQTKYISFTSAKYLIATDMKKVQFKDQATKLNRVCDDILELMPRLFKRMNRIVAEYHQKVRNGELPSIEERKTADVVAASICLNRNPNIKKEMALVTQTTDDMEVEQQRMMREWVVAQVDKQTLTYIQNCTKPWDKQELIRNLILSLGIKDLLGVPVVYGIKKNKLKYNTWYCISTISQTLGRRVDNIKSQLLKGYDFLTIEELEKKYEPPQFKGVRYDHIIPNHLKTDYAKRYKYVNHQAIMMLIRDIAYKKEIVSVKGADVRPWAKDMIKSLDGLDEVICDLVEEMSSVVAEYRHKDQQRELLDFRKQNDVIKAERESIKSERLALAMRFHDVILDREETIYIVSSDDKMKIGHYKVGKSTLELLKSRLSTLQTGTPELKVIYQFKCRNAKALEAVIHNTLEGYGIRLTKEWFLIKVLDKLVEFIQMVVDDEEKWLNSTQDFPAITRQAICGYELPDVVIEAPPQQLVIEENKEAICKRVTEQVIRALMDGVTPIKPKQITKKAIQEVIDNAKEKINVSKLISIEITLNDQVYLIESDIPDGKKQKRIYIKIKQ
jgi:hypothetical protein